jgi:hypothetical protein
MNSDTEHKGTFSHTNEGNLLDLSLFSNLLFTYITLMMLPPKSSSTRFVSFLKAVGSISLQGGAHHHKIDTRQSVRLSLKSSELGAIKGIILYPEYRSFWSLVGIGSAHLLTRRRVMPPFGSGGGDTHSLSREEVGGPNSDEGTDIVIL